MAWKTAETIYFVRDLDDAVRCHVDRLGFELVGQWDFGFALVRSPDGHAIGLMPVASWSTDWKPDDPLPVPRLSLQTDDIAAEVARLEAAGVGVESLRQGRGMHWTTFHDDDGNPFMLWDDLSGSLDATSQGSSPTPNGSSGAPGSRD